jgi:hypothetical protein
VRFGVCSARPFYSGFGKQCDVCCRRGPPVVSASSIGTVSSSILSCEAGPSCLCRSWPPRSTRSMARSLVTACLMPEQGTALLSLRSARYSLPTRVTSRSAVAEATRGVRIKAKRAFGVVAPRRARHRCGSPNGLVIDATGQTGWRKRHACRPGCLGCHVRFVACAAIADS